MPKATVEHVIIRKMDSVTYQDSMIPLERPTGVKYWQPATLVTVFGRQFQVEWSSPKCGEGVDVWTLDEVVLDLE